MYRVGCDPFQPKVDDNYFESGTTDWQDFYGDINEEITLGIPETLVNNTHTMCFVDSNHSGNTVTWSLHIGVLIYVMNAPIIWFSKI